MFFNIFYYYIFVSIVGVNSVVFRETKHIIPDGEYTDEECLMYNHMPKSGGTTIIGLMTNKWGDRVGHWGSGNWKLREKWMDVWANKFMNKIETGKKNILVGETIEALERTELKNKCKKFTVFREPVSRMISAYFYCKKIQTDSLCGTEIVNSRDVDLLTFAKHWGNFSMRQFILSFISSDVIIKHSEDNMLQVDMDLWYKIKNYIESKSFNEDIPEFELFKYLKPVEDIIKNEYIVGLVENFNSTMNLFDKSLGMPKEVMVWEDEYKKSGKSNTNHNDNKIPYLMLAGVDSEIKKYLQIDILLYEHVVSVFNSQLKEYGI